MANQDNKQPSAQDLLREGYAKTQTEQKKNEKKDNITVELTELEKEHASPVYLMSKWYAKKAKQEQSKAK